MEAKPFERTYHWNEQRDSRARCCWETGELPRLLKEGRGSSSLYDGGPLKPDEG